MSAQKSNHSASEYPYWTELPQPEHQARRRRVLQFLEASGLIPVSNKIALKTPLKQLFDAEFADHCSTWRDGSGSLYVLIEPYGWPSANELNALDARGFASIEIPVDMSPYCGRWDPKPGALPHTRSYLFTVSVNAGAVSKIAEMLDRAAKTCPPWNSLVGGGHV